MILISFVNFDYLDLGLFKTSHAWTKIKIYFYCIYCPLNYANNFPVQQRTVFCFVKAHQVSVLILAVFLSTMLSYFIRVHSFPRTQCVFMVKETTTESILYFYFTVICTVIYSLFVYQLLHQLCQ